MLTPDNSEAGLHSCFVIYETVADLRDWSVKKQLVMRLHSFRLCWY